MKSRINRILVIQTAFIGDAILTLPLVQVLKKNHPDAEIDVVVVPRSAELFRNHPAITRILEYDKRGQDRGVRGFLQLLRQARESRYDVAVVPHRSLRSALLAAFARIPARIGFTTSAGRFLFTESVKYRKDIHEIDRNLSLLEGVNGKFEGRELPDVFPSQDDVKVIDRFLASSGITDGKKIVALAPGTIWNTKRWLKERFGELSILFVNQGYGVILVGGSEDETLCGEIQKQVGGESIVNACGRLSLLQSAELLRRCRVLVSNDSAPMHLSVAVRTPVIAIFGATVPAFGFAPYGERDVVVETLGLTCRPCSIHGGEKCPIKTFVCMKDITSERVYREAMRILSETDPH
ncbi:MAG: lipopolysaccharide heptosyltransferase II [Ignavibacteriales bacterium]|nr:lipopolysaccharide heptosyltransferase II [Ignavibacteriales bacterium]